MTKLQNVYVKTNSYNLWWGAYGLCQLTGWEDIVFYDGIDKANKWGHTISRVEGVVFCILIEI